MADKDDAERPACVVEDDQPEPIELSMTPARNPGVSIRETGEEDGKYVVFEPERETVLLMNRMGKTIFDSCDGSRTIGEIIDLLGQDHEVPQGLDLHEVVKSYFAILRLTRLIEVRRS